MRNSFNWNTADSKQRYHQTLLMATKRGDMEAVQNLLTNAESYCDPNLSINYYCQLKSIYLNQYLGYPREPNLNLPMLRDLAKFEQELQEKIDDIFDPLPPLEEVEEEGSDEISDFIELDEFIELENQIKELEEESVSNDDETHCRCGKRIPRPSEICPCGNAQMQISDDYLPVVAVPGLTKPEYYDPKTELLLPKYLTINHLGMTGTDPKKFIWSVISKNDGGYCWTCPYVTEEDEDDEYSISYSNSDDGYTAISQDDDTSSDDTTTSSDDTTTSSDDTTTSSDDTTTSSDDTTTSSDDTTTSSDDSDTSSDDSDTSSDDSSYEYETESSEESLKKQPKKVVTLNIQSCELVQHQKITDDNRQKWINYVTKNCTDLDSFMKVIDYGFATSWLESKYDTVFVRRFFSKVIELDLVDVLMAINYNWPSSVLDEAITHNSFRIATYLTRFNKKHVNKVIKKYIDDEDYDLIKKYLSNVYVDELKYCIYEELIEHPELHQVLIDQKFVTVKHDIIEYFNDQKQFQKLKKFVNKHF